MRAALDGLHDQHALQHASIDQRNAEERLVIVFASLVKIFESRMIFRLLDSNRAHLLGDQARQAFVDSHAESADTLAAQPDGCGQHQIRAVGFEKIDRADVGFEALGDQRDHVHQRLGRLAALSCEVSDLFESQDVVRVAYFRTLAHALHSLVIWFSSDARLCHRVCLYLSHAFTAKCRRGATPVTEMQPLVYRQNSSCLAQAKSNPNC